MFGLIATDIEGYKKAPNGAVINTDEGAFKQYIRQREITTQKTTQVNELTDKVSSLENKLSNIESLLKQLLNKAE